MFRAVISSHSCELSFEWMSSAWVRGAKPGNLRKTCLSKVTVVFVVETNPPHPRPHRSSPTPLHLVYLSLDSTVVGHVSVYLESIVGIDAAPAALLQLHL